MTGNKKNEMPIRVAHVIGSISKGGVETVVFNYYRVIDRTQIQFDFIIDEDSPYEISSDIIELGCKIYKIPSYKNLPVYIKELIKIFKNYRIVHSHMNSLSVFALYAAKRAGVRIRIAHSHNTEGKGEFKRNLLKAILRPFSKLYSTHYLACSEHAGRWLFGNNVFNQGRVTLILNAFDTSKFHYNHKIRRQVRNKLNISDKLVIGHVGRFVSQKNHYFLVNVFKEIHNQNSDSILLLVGDGPLKYKIIDKVHQLGLSNNVLFLCSRNDVHELYQAMDVFVFPSLYEGFGLVAVEAQSSGLQCILSDKVPSEAILISNQCKVISLQHSTKIWADQILSSITGNSQNTHINQIKDYDIQYAVSKLEGFYMNNEYIPNTF